MKGKVFLSIFAILFIFTMVFIATGFDTVDANQKAVVMKFGKPIAEMNPGMQYTGHFVNVEPYSTLTRKMSITLSGENYAPSATQQRIFAKVNLNYRLNEQTGTVTALKMQFGGDNDLEEKLNIQSLVTEGVKQAISKYTAEEIQLDRETVKALIKEKVQANFPNNYFILEQIIVENIWFTEDYQSAIDQIASAKKRAEAKEKEQEVVNRQIEIDLAQAQRDQDVRKKNADALAYELTSKAAAEAQATKVKMEAEAAGLAAKKQELTALMVEQTKWENWNGVMPTHILGDSDLLMSIN